MQACCELRLSQEPRSTNAESGRYAKVSRRKTWLLVELIACWFPCMESGVRSSLYASKTPRLRSSARFFRPLHQRLRMNRSFALLLAASCLTAFGQSDSFKKSCLRGRCHGQFEPNTLRKMRRSSMFTIKLPERLDAVQEASQ